MNAYTNQAINNRPKLPMGLQVGMRVQTSRGEGYISSLGYAVNGYMLNTSTMCALITLIENPNVTFQVSYNAIVFSNNSLSELTIFNQTNTNL